MDFNPNSAPDRVENPNGTKKAGQHLPSPFPNGDEYLKPRKRWSAALVVALIYAGVASAWILVSDSAVDLLVLDFEDEMIVQSVKGLAFVLVTAILLYVLMRSMQVRELVMASRLREAIDASRDGLWRWDLKNDRIAATPGGDTELGWNAADAIRDAASWQAAVHPDDWNQVESKLAELQRTGGARWHLEQRLRTAEGGWLWFQFKGRVVARNGDGSIAAMEGSYHGSEALKRTQENLERANRALHILVATYDAVTGETSLKRVFETLVDQVGNWPAIAIAWVGEARDDGVKRIVPVAAAGPAAEFPARAGFRWDDSEFGSGPLGTSIKTGQPALVADVRTEPSVAPWRDLLERYAIRSSVAIPIVSEGNPTYALHVAGAQPGMFPTEDSETYAVIARVLAYASRSMDSEFQFTLSESARMDMAERLQKAVQGTITALATVVEKRDPYTSGHQHRVADLAVAFGREMGLGEDRIEGLRIGAWIHDVGKIGIPTEKSIDFGWPVEKIVHEHHERWDGSGYPQGLKGEAITFEARIVAVADVIESMGTDRPYRPKIPWQRVVDEITQGRAVRYDERVVDAAMAVLDRDAISFGFHTGK